MLSYLKSKSIMTSNIQLPVLPYCEDFSITLSLYIYSCISVLGEYDCPNQKLNKTSISILSRMGLVLQQQSLWKNGLAVPNNNRQSQKSSI